MVKSGSIFDEILAQVSGAPESDQYTSTGLGAGMNGNSAYSWSPRPVSHNAWKMRPGVLHAGVPLDSTARSSVDARRFTMCMWSIFPLKGKAPTLTSVLVRRATPLFSSTRTAVLAPASRSQAYTRRVPTPEFTSVSCVTATKYQGDAFGSSMFTVTTGAGAKVHSFSPSHRPNWPASFSAIVPQAQATSGKVSDGISCTCTHAVIRIPSAGSVFSWSAVSGNATPGCCTAPGKVRARPDP
mmetsp:Transcript_10952/g.34788  ORF Transcript_10952/g.34788 Transcript_10952/m.34788 type:complete len:241 (-) Transcript_10952:4935-5657(-)